jgi:hypothetical protein
MPKCSKPCGCRFNCEWLQNGREAAACVDGQLVGTYFAMWFMIPIPGVMAR